jgi:hypothetical protein
MKEARNTFRMLVEKPLRTAALGKMTRMGEKNIKWYLW